MIFLYSAAMTLLVAQTFGIPGYVAWACLWTVLVYRHVLTTRRGMGSSEC